MSSVCAGRRKPAAVGQLTAWFPHCSSRTELCALLPSHGCCQLLFPQELSTSSLTSVPLLAWFYCVWISKMLGCEAQNCCWNSHSVELYLKLKSILNLWYIFDLIFFVVAYISGSMPFFSKSTFPALNAVRFQKCFLLGKLYEELK